MHFNSVILYGQGDYLGIWSAITVLCELPDAALLLPQLQPFHWQMTSCFNCRPTVRKE